MKKLLLSLLCVGFVQNAFGAASAGESVGPAVGVEASDQSITLVFHKSGSDLSELENVYVRGRKVKMKDFPGLDDSLRSEFHSKCKDLSISICLREKTIGCILASGNSIKWIVIDPEHQGKGLAGQALDMFACQTNLNMICLQPLNAKLEAFYLKKCGFQMSDEDIEYRNAMRQECMFGRDSYIACCLTKNYK